MRACSFSGCGKRHEAHGLCPGHLYQYKAGQELRPIGGRPTAPGMKTCSLCKAEKPLDGFSRDRKAKSGRKSSCKPCHAASTSARRRADPLRKEKAREHRKNNIERVRAAERRWYAENRERIRELDKAWRHAHPETVFARNLSRHHLTVAEYEKILADQGGVCAGCKTETGEHLWNIDHDHGCCAGQWSCGECVRGLLCAPCNKAAGFVEDNAETLLRLANYVDLYAITGKPVRAMVSAA